MGASFYAYRSQIDGKLSSYGADAVGTGGGGFSPIGGNVSVDSTTGYVYFDASIGGNASITNNNDVYLEGVAFGGNLACSGNSDVYMNGGSVAGHASGQCANYGASG